MPSADEVKQLEGVSAAQHRFRLPVEPLVPEKRPSSRASLQGLSANSEGGANAPFVYCQMPYRNSRYKEKFQALREKYERVTAKKEEYNQDLELAAAKIKKLQAENDLLLDAMNLAASHQPAMFGSMRPPDMPPGAPMDIDGYPPANNGPLDRPPPRHINGTGSSNGTRSGSSNSVPNSHTNGAAHSHPPDSRPPHRSRQPSIEFLPHDMNGRAP
ncbi:hypothetical protein R3P38DRAFT_817668 [Favolaschia claudopus]|uniref:BZIP domain-containing protein n=1 Tax=Favolaschia claudopus TaxID=2862362 RepID=A0AAW0BZX6_9AGAR